MIAKEMQEEPGEGVVDVDPEDFTATVEEGPGHAWSPMKGHRLNLVTFPRTEKTYTAKRSCKHCYGTGVAAMKCEGQPVTDPKTKKSDYSVKIPIQCTCLKVVETEEEEQTDAKKE